MDITSKLTGNKDFVTYVEKEYSEVYSCPQFKGIQPEIIKIDGCWINSSLLVQDLELFKSIKEFEVRNDDVFIVGFPRCGNTLVNELVYLIMNKADTTKARDEILEQRVPYLEFPVPGLKNVATRPSPRIIKSHLPFQLMPEQIYSKKCKVIYLMRNAKDVCVSFYHFVQYFYTLDYQGTFEEFYKDFVEGKVGYGPFFDHVCSFWENKEKLNNLLFVKYEDIAKDIHDVIKQIAQFLDKELGTDEINIIAEHCKVENMKHNKSTNFIHLEEQKFIKPSPESGERVGLIRKGVVGDWRNYFTPEMAEAMDKLTKEKWEPIGLKFSDENNSWNF